MVESNEGSGGLQHMFRALGHRNFRLFFVGQTISLIGTWMQQVAMSWLIYRLTHSAVLLGVVNFAAQIPSLVLTPLGGALADRINKRKMVTVCQSLAMILALVLAWLTLSGVLQVWYIVALAALNGVVNAFEIPSRQAFMVEMLEDKRDLPNAIALNSSIFNSARLIGPSIGGLLIGWLGEGMCFLVNGLSYIAVVVALLAMKLTPSDKRVSESHILEHIKEGFVYVYGFAPLRSIMLLLAVVSLVGMPYVVLMPIVAHDILGGNAYTLGFLMAASGLGALIGAMFLASRRSVLGLGNWIVAACCIFSLSLMAFAFSKVLWLSMTLLVVVGFGMMVQMGSSNTVIQTMVDEDKRGRVMSLYVMAFMGPSPFGSLLAGTLAHKIGVPYTIAGSGLLSLLGGLVFMTQLPNLRQKVRPIYVAKGIISED